MGAQARATRKRRELARQTAAAMRAERDRERADPAYQEALAATLADPDVIRLVGEDAPGQVERLERAGWRLVRPADNGLGAWDHRNGAWRLMHSVARYGGEVWGHVSLSRRDHALPGWYDLRDVQWLFYPGRYGVIVVAPTSRHVNMAEVHHVWTCLTRPAVPDFAIGGGV